MESEIKKIKKKKVNFERNKIDIKKFVNNLTKLSVSSKKNPKRKCHNFLSGLL